MFKAGDKVFHSRGDTKLIYIIENVYSNTVSLVGYGGQYLKQDFRLCYTTIQQIVTHKLLEKTSA